MKRVFFPWLFAFGVVVHLAMHALPPSWAGGFGVGSGGLNGFPPSSDSSSGTADTFTSTSSSIRVPLGTANFSCPNNPGTSSPCLANFNHPLELGGLHPSQPWDYGSDIYMGCMEMKDGGACLEILNNYGAPTGGNEITLARFTVEGDLRMKHWLYLNEDVGTDGRIITNGSFYNMSTGPIIMWNQGSGNVQTWFSTGGATQVMNLTAGAGLDISDGTSSGTCTLNGASPAVCTFPTFASARCNANTVGTTAASAKALALSLSSTTLTVTAANGSTEVVQINCH